MEDYLEKCLKLLKEGVEDEDGEILYPSKLSYIKTCEVIKQIYSINSTLEYNICYGDEGYDLFKVYHLQDNRWAFVININGLGNISYYFGDDGTKGDFFDEKLIEKLKIIT